MSDRIVTFTYLGRRFKFEIPYLYSLVINLYQQIIKQCNLEADAKITLFSTLANGKQHIFQLEETIDSFIEKSKGGIVTIYVKTPAPQGNYIPSRITELKPGEELHMANSNPSSHTVIEGKKINIVNKFITSFYN